MWSMEKLENKLIDMREMYQEYKDRPVSMTVNYFFQIKCCNLHHTNNIALPLMLLSLPSLLTNNN